VRPRRTLALVCVEQQKGGDGARHTANLHARRNLTRRIRTWKSLTRACTLRGVAEDRRPVNCIM
jgi:hypothetical protein